MKSFAAVLTSLCFASLSTSALAAESGPIKRHRTRVAVQRGAHSTAVPSASSAATGSAHAKDAAGGSELDAKERQHTGFFLKAELGLGYRSFGSKWDGTALRVKGFGAAGSVLLGGAMVPNLVLFGEGTFSNVVNPTLTLGDESMETDDVTSTIAGIGPGFVYYLMPANVFFGASVLLTRLRVSQGDEPIGETDLGFGGSVRVGKEWWTRPGHALGVVAQYSLSSMSDKNDGPIWLTNSVTLSASYTYN